MRTMQCVRTLNLRSKFDVHHPAAGARRLWLHGTYLLYGCMAGICGPADVGRPSSALADMVRCAASLRMDGGAVSWCAETPCAACQVSGVLVWLRSGHVRTPFAVRVRLACSARVCRLPIRVAGGFAGALLVLYPFVYLRTRRAVHTSRSIRSCGLFLLMGPAAPPTHIMRNSCHV